jgi:hypothetical protein
LGSLVLDGSLVKLVFILILLVHLGNFLCLLGFLLNKGLGIFVFKTLELGFEVALAGIELLAVLRLRLQLLLLLVELPLGLTQLLLQLDLGSLDLLQLRRLLLVLVLKGLQLRLHVLKL